MARVKALGLKMPDELVPVAFDFEQARLGEALAAAGLDLTDSVFISWLGVVPYLTSEAIAATLRALPACSLAVAYVPPQRSWDATARRLGRVFQKDRAGGHLESRVFAAPSI